MGDNIFAYSGITTKAKAMQKKLLKEEEYSYIAQLTSVHDFVLFLKSHEAYQSYFEQMNENNVHRGDVERVLRTSLYKSFESLYEFAESTQKKQLGLIYYHYEVTMLNDCLKRLFNKQVQVNADTFLQVFHSRVRIPIEQLMEANSLDEFFTLLKQTPYEKVFTSKKMEINPTLFDLSMQLNSSYYKTLWKMKNQVLSKSQNEVYSKCLGTKIDVQNIMSIYRCKKYYQVDRAKISSILIPVNYHLTSAEMNQLITTSTISEFISVLQKTRYAIKKDEVTQEDMEHTYLQQVDQAYVNSKSKAPLSMAPIYCYLYQKERELDKLTTVLEGIRYGLSEEKILHMIQG